MANLYIRSTDGNDADNGSTWALAKAKLAGADAIDTAGDDIYLSQVHSESSATTVALSFAGTNAAPTRILCVNDGAEPPTTLTTGAIVATTGANPLRITGNLYCEGVQFKAGDGNGLIQLAPNYTAGAYTQRYVNCEMYLGDTNAGSSINIGASESRGQTNFVNTNFRLSNAGQKIFVNGKMHIVGGAISAGTSALSYLFSFNTSATAVEVLVEGFDFSVLPAAFDIMLAPARPGIVVVRGCTMPASWSGDLISAAITCPTFRAELYDCTNATTTWLQWIEDYCGTIKAETTLVRTGSLAPYSLNMTSNAKANEAFGHLKSNEIFLGVGTPGSAQTATFEILHDSVTNLTDAEIWVEVEYRDTSGSRRSVEITDKRVTVLATPTDQTTSAVAWTTTGMTNPNKQKLSVTFTPQVAGYSVARIVLAKPSKTVYVDTDSGVV